MYRSLSRCLAAGAVFAVTLTACGGGAHTTPDASSPLKSQAAVTTAKNNPTISSNYDTSPSRGGIKPALLGGLIQAQLAAEKVRSAGKLGVVPLLQSIPSAGSIHQITHLGTGTAPFASAAASGGVGALTAQPTALVLYDTAGQWGYLGELYAMAVANLAGHFGPVSTEPISAYTTGQVNQFTATFYIGSSYYEQGSDGIPVSFYKDVAASTHPLVWIGYNIWNFADYIGTATFDQKYGWDPTNSYFTNSSGSVGNVTQVTYKTEPLTRTIPAGDDGGVLRPAILGTGYPAVTTLATAVDTSTSPATSFPWAFSSGNITYIGEIPFNYVTESDRVICFEDLMFNALAPTTATRHRAMMRLEDLNAFDDQTQLMQVAQYLAKNKIPYGFNVIPLYEDPLGVYNNGKPMSIALNSSAAASFVTTIKYMLANGGTMISEGYTHQYSNVDNPYDGVSGDDAEFYLASINASNSVTWNGPIPGDSTTWAQGRADNAVLAFKSVNLTPPKVWVTPHYFATDVDYRAFATDFAERYESSVYYSGVLSKQPVNYSELIGEFFPYAVQDVYGTTVLPENLGDYEPTSLNGNPVRTAADLIAEAKLNLAVRDGYASFFYAPSYGTSVLGQVITGIKNLGYTFEPTGS